MECFLEKYMNYCMEHSINLLILNFLKRVQIAPFCTSENLGCIVSFAWLLAKIPRKHVVCEDYFLFV